MASVIMIRRENGGAIESNLYGKPDDVKLDSVEDPTVLWSSPPKIYLTGLTSLKTQKKLALVLARIDPSSSYKLERLPAEDILGALGVTARAKREGRIMPKYGRGG